MTAALVDPPEIADPTPWWFIEHLDLMYEDDPTVIVNHAPPKITDHVGGVGGWSLEISLRGNDVTPFFLEHRLVRVSILDIFESNEASEPVYKPVFVGMADKPDQRTVTRAETIGTLTLTGRSAAAMFDYVLVEPLWDQGPTPSGRWWNFGHKSIDIFEAPWVRSTYRSTQGDTTALPPNGLAGLPWQFCNPLAFWISSRPADGADPEGVTFHGFDYELDRESELVFETTGDDAISVFVNEIPLGDVWDEPEGDAAEAAWRARGVFPAGPLRVRVAVANFHRDAPVENNCCLFTLACSRVVDDEFGRYVEEWLFTTANGYDEVGDEWRSLDFPETPPGPRIGHVLWDQLIDLLGPVTTTYGPWGFSFGPDVDSAGNPFDEIPWFRMDIGQSFLDTLNKLRDEGWIEYDVDVSPDGRLVLGVWNAGTAGQHREDVELARGNSAGTGVVTDLQHELDHAAVWTGILAEYSGGYVAVGSGPKRKFVKLGNDVVSQADAERMAQRILDENDTPRESITVDMTWARQADGPVFGGWGKRDWISGLDHTMTMQPYRIVSMGIAGDSETGKPVFTPKLNTRVDEFEERQARLLNRAAAGGLGGRSSASFVSSARQQPMTKVDLVTMTWSAPGDPSQEERELAFGAMSPLVYGSPAIPPPVGQMRVTRMKVTAEISELDYSFMGPDPGDIDTDIAVISGLDLIADDTLSMIETESWRSFLSSVVFPGTNVESRVTYGKHRSIGIILYGGEMGRSPAEPKVAR